MKKIGLILLPVLLMALLCGALALAEDASGEMDEWTVMFYFCGSDLESKYSYATGNLEEISLVQTPDNYLVAEKTNRDIPVLSQPGKVNLLVETGGASQWHAQELGMDIATDALQRWRFNVYPWGGMGTRQMNGYELMETLPLQSMADPGTLTDFIRWGKQTCPAKKYALVLWDHGDGARTGLFIDELFDRDTMYLYELREALLEADTHLEALIIDACLMANVETAWAVSDSADWMVASEENVPGNGTAIDKWLQQLFNNPWGDGEWLGRCVCDTTAIKYADDADARTESLLTWSVIDLAKLDALVEDFGDFFGQVGDLLVDHTEWINLFMRSLFSTVECGDGLQDMRDLGSLLYDPGLAHYLDLSQTGRVLRSMTDAVAYCVRGSGRAETRGLTFCYPVDFSGDALDHYAQNFPLPEYLALIDAMSPWSAPDWVYESTGRLPETDSIDALQLYAQKQLNADGMPGVLFKSPEPNLNDMYYRLYRLDEATGEVVRLGRTNCVYESTEDFDGIWHAADPMHWPAIDGELICMDMIKLYADRKLYNVPVMINGQGSVLRLSRRTDLGADETDPPDEYTVVGAWEGQNEYSDLMNRSLKPLAMLVGREYRLLYPVDGAGTAYHDSAPLTMYRSLDVQEVPLPAGTYFLEYEIVDVFMHSTVLDRVEIQWDGNTMTFPGAGDWHSGDWTHVAELGK